MNTHCFPPIWFLRHGQTEWNAAYRLQGQLDSPLTAQGRADAARQGAILRDILPQAPAIYVSPLGRTLQTAAIALAGTPYQTDARLMEIHAGQWQGRLRRDIMAELPELAQSNPNALEIYEAAPEGEGLTVFAARIAEFLADLTGPSVIIAHGLLGQVLRAQITGIDLAQAGALSNDQGCIYHLENGIETVLDAS
ncbi:MAG: histidine phosphatase family protein [Sulfitobacter sp.]